MFKFKIDQDSHTHESHVGIELILCSYLILEGSGKGDHGFTGVRENMSKENSGGMFDENETSTEPVQVIKSVGHADFNFTMAQVYDMTKDQARQLIRDGRLHIINKIDDTVIFEMMIVTN